jgi:single-stranded-DNA-specific exonuclease
MKILTRPEQPRLAWALEQAGIHPLLARLYANRGVQSAADIHSDLRALLPPQGMKGMDAAVQLLAQARAAEKAICIVADYDCDGATACAVLLRGLRLLGFSTVDFLVPDRVVDGYGLTPAISQRVAATGAQLLLTVDNGIASVEGVQTAKDLGLQVLVTDHHLPAAQLPVADAIVNPNQPGCGFASKALAGVGVAFYVLLALRAHLREAGIYTAQNQPRLDSLLPLVALGTVADVVPLDANNRRLVAQGLKRMRTGALPAGMAALAQVAGRELRTLSAMDLGFALGPRLNAAGRLADMRMGIACLCTDDAAQAQVLAEQLDAINRERRELQADMQEQAMLAVDAYLKQDKANTDSAAQLPAAITVFDDSFHEGVVGIVAARIKDRLHRPTFVFAASAAPGQAGLLKGSGRSITGFHLRDALDLVAKRHPGVLLRFGGHAMAAGCSIPRERLADFQQAIAEVAAQWLDADTLQQKLLTDGALAAADLRVDVADSLAQEVWGQGFAPPIFSDRCELLEQRIVGNGHSKLKVQVAGQSLDAIWFGRVDALPRQLRLAFRLDVNEWRNQRNLQLLVEAVERF